MLCVYSVIQRFTHTNEEKPKVCECVCESWAKEQKRANMDNT